MDKASILSDLRSNVAEIIFKNDDGKFQKIRASMSSDHIPVNEVIVDSDHNTVTVWDIDNKNWCSFKLNKAISIQRVNTA